MKEKLLPLLNALRALHHPYFEETFNDFVALEWEGYGLEELKNLAGNLIIDYNDNHDDGVSNKWLWKLYLKPIDDLGLFPMGIND